MTAFPLVCRLPLRRKEFHAGHAGINIGQSLDAGAQATHLAGLPVAIQAVVVFEVAKNGRHRRATAVLGPLAERVGGRRVRAKGKAFAIAGGDHQGQVMEDAFIKVNGVLPFFDEGLVRIGVGGAVVV